MKPKEIIDSLSHLFYVQLNNRSPGFTRVQLHCSQKVCTPLQEQSVLLRSHRVLGETIFIASRNIQQVYPHPPPASTSFPKASLPYLSVQMQRNSNGKHLKKTYLHSLHSWHGSQSNLAFYSLVWQLRVQPSSSCHLSKSSTAWTRAFTSPSQPTLP